MPERKRRKRRGADFESAHILFDELVVCERAGTIFYAGGRSKDYHRSGAMTEGYVRELVAKLKALLRDLDRERGTPAGHQVDRVHLDKAKDGALAFSLFDQGEEVCCGTIAPDAVESAWRFLDAIQARGKIVPMRGKR